MNTKYNNLANTIRSLSIDAIQKAKSGHPGLPMGMADVASVLFYDFLKFNPEDPEWINRDRFVLSGGHGSMLLYSLLHLFGYGLSIEDIKNFRQWGSKTPGHPEYGHTKGVETTTGPLGQGLANAVGMAIGETILSKNFNIDKKLFDYNTYVFFGDGDLMEGISHEACSLAGNLKLNKLIGFYDKNGISIDGSTKITFADDVKSRFESYGWKVIEIFGHNVNEIKSAIKKAKKQTKNPTLIVCNTIIGYGSPNKAGTSGVHGSPLGSEEIKLTKENLGITQDEFFVPDNVYDFVNESLEEKKLKYDRWMRKYDNLKIYNPYLYKKIDDFINKRIDSSIFAASKFKFPEKIATRSASQIVIDNIFNKIPNLLGGSADLTPSNNTRAKDSVDYSPKNTDGRYMRYGVRETWYGLSNEWIGFVIGNYSFW
ncbi:MAG: hypothetical protein R2771_10280 [Saprospiraceae bacterium]